MEKIIIKTDRSEPDAVLLNLFASINLLFPECNVQVLPTADFSSEKNVDILSRDIPDS